MDGAYYLRAKGGKSAEEVLNAAKLLDLVFASTLYCRHKYKYLSLKFDRGTIFCQTFQLSISRERKREIIE